MAQPLMVTSVSLPPAQAEALYDASLNNALNHASDGPSGLPPETAAWPGEDWDDPPQPLPSPLPRPPLRRSG